MAKTLHGGTIISREYKTGTFLYFRKYKDRKIYSTGLIDTPKNRKILERMLEKAYLDYLNKTSQVIPEILPKITYTIGELWQIYKDKFLASKEKKTQKSYELSYKQLITNNDIDPELIINIRNSQVNYLYEHISNNIALSNQSNNSINLKLRSVQAFLNWLLNNGYLEHKIDLRKLKRETQKKEIHAYSENTLEQIEKLLQKQDREFFLLLQLQANLGLRIKESLELMWEQVDFEKNKIIMPNKIKKNQSDYLPITGKVKEILLELKEISEKRFLETKKAKLFRWHHESSSRLNKKFNKLLETANLKVDGVSFHGFRKMFMNKVSKKNVNVIQFMQLSRIRDLKTAQNHYLQNDIDKMIEILEN